MALNKTITIKQGNKKANLNKKIVHFFTLKMFRYTLIKMLKSPSTWVMFVLTLIAGLSMIMALTFGIQDVPSGDYTNIAKGLFLIYAWVWYMLYFGLTGMFIGLKSVQLIRDEIDDGTLLIFSSIPMSRTRMIIEKWLALQLLCLLYSVVILLLPSILALGMGAKGTAFGKVILSKVNFMILTSFIIQLFLTTIGILISLGLNSKGVIGILSTIGFLTTIGAMIPFIYNTTKMMDNATQSLIKTTNLAKNSIKFKDSDLSKTYADLLDPTGWPVWMLMDNKLRLTDSSSKISDKLDATSLGTDINLVVDKIATKDESISWNDVIREFKKAPNNYPTLASLINNNVLKFDGYKTNKFTGIILDNKNKVEFIKNSDKGVNILSDFYNAVSSQDTITISPVKPTSNGKIDLNVLDQSKLKNKTQENIYQIMKAMFVKKIFSPVVIEYSKNMFDNLSGPISPYSISSLIYDKLSSANKNKFKNFSGDFQSFLNETLYQENVYLNDPIMSLYSQFANQMATWLSGGIYDKHSDIYPNEEELKSELNNVKKAQKNYKLMAYLNIWQQWVVMWTGNASGDVSEGSITASLQMLPINNYLDIKVSSVTYKQNDASNKTNYFLISDFNKPVVLTSLGGMYASYLVVTFALAGLTLWWITRKDFV